VHAKNLKKPRNFPFQKVVRILVAISKNDRFALLRSAVPAGNYFKLRARRQYQLITGFVTFGCNVSKENNL
jgi:hypothetical protein